MEQELSKKERRELRRQERQQVVQSETRKKKFRIWIIWGAVILVIAAVGYFAYKYVSKVSNIPDIGEVFPIEGSNHIAEGTKVNYKTNPPSSGDHYGTPANWGIYDHEIPDEAVVHNLEHGGIWISYRPDVPEATKEKLRSLAGEYSGKIILTPRAANDSPIAIVSWGRIHKMGIGPDGSFNADTIYNFISKYRNRGPENVPEDRKST